MDAFQNPSALRQRLRFELQGLQSRDLEQQSVGAVRIVLNGIRNGPLVKPAVQELLSDLGTSSKNAVKLRLQLAEYCILKCANKSQLPAVLPLILKQANTVLANNRNDAACVSSLAALLSSMLAKVLHEPSMSGGYAQAHGFAETSRLQTADGLCDAILFPIIKSTYRDPEHSRVSAGSVVLLGMLEVMKVYARQSYEVQEAIRRCLVLVMQLLAQGSFTLRVPGVLLPVCACLEALGASITEDIAKRILLLCLKSVAVKEMWQVRRDGLQTLEMLATVLQPTVLVPLDAAADSAAQEALTIRAPATEVMVARKQHVVQVLEDARYDKIAAVRTAAVAAVAAVQALPDPLKPAEPAVEAEPATPTTDAAPSKRKKWDSSAGKRRSLADGKHANGRRPDSTGRTRLPRFSRPQHTPGTVLDYGIQVFAPPSPPKQLSPAAAVPDVAHASPADQSPVRRQLSFDKHETQGVPNRLRQSADASCQTPPSQHGYTVQSPGTASYRGQDSAAAAAAGASPRSPLAAASSQLYAADALQLLDQNQRQAGLSAMLAMCGGSPARVDVSHHVHGRVELGIVYSHEISGSPVRADIAAAMAAAAAFGPMPAAAQAERSAAESEPAAAGVSSATLVASTHRALWPNQQQQASGQQGEQAAAESAAEPAAGESNSSAPQQHDQRSQPAQQSGSIGQGVVLEPSFCSGLAGFAVQDAASRAHPSAEHQEISSIAAQKTTERHDSAEHKVVSDSIKAQQQSAVSADMLPGQAASSPADSQQQAPHSEAPLDAQQHKSSPVQQLLQQSHDSLRRLLQAEDTEDFQPAACLEKQHSNSQQQAHAPEQGSELLQYCSDYQQQCGVQQQQQHWGIEEQDTLAVVHQQDTQQQAQVQQEELQQQQLQQPDLQQIMHQQPGRQQQQQQLEGEQHQQQQEDQVHMLDPQRSSSLQSGVQRTDSTNSSTNSMNAPGEQSHRSRQRWQLPGSGVLDSADQLTTDAAAPTAVSTSPITMSETQGSRRIDTSSNSRPSSRAGSRPCSRQHSRACSRQGSRNAHSNSSNSLDVLRSVGERVQGLLEALSRQTSGGGARPDSGSSSATAVITVVDNAATAEPAAAVEAVVLVTAPGTAAAVAALEGPAVISPTPSSPAQHTLRSALEDMQSLLNPEAHPSDAQVQQSDVTQGEQQQQWPVSSAGASSGTNSAGAGSNSSSPSSDVVQPATGEPCCLPHPHNNAAFEQINLTAPEEQQGDAAHGSSSMVLQPNELFEPSSTGATIRASPAEPPATVDDNEASGPPLAGNDAAGLAQVERALQKLQTLRCTLQSIGGSAASSQQLSRRESSYMNAEAGVQGSHQTTSAGMQTPTATSIAAEGAEYNADIPLQAAQALVAQDLQQHTADGAADGAVSLVKDRLQHISQQLRNLGSGVDLPGEVSEPEVQYAGRETGAGPGAVESHVQQPQQTSIPDWGSNLLSVSSNQAAATGDGASDLIRLGAVDTAVDSLDLSDLQSQLSQCAAASPATSVSWSAASTCSPDTYPAADSITGAAEKTADTQGPVQDLPGQRAAVGQQLLLGSGAGSSPAGTKLIQTAGSNEAARPLGLVTDTAQQASSDEDSRVANSLSTSHLRDVAGPAGGDVSKLQQMLDASDDTALLMSLAFKLDSLAKKFKRQGSGFQPAPAVAQQDPNTDTPPSSISGLPVPWTSVVHNQLFVLSPDKSIKASNSHLGAQLQSQCSQPATQPEHSAQRQPAGSHIGYEEQGPGALVDASKLPRKILVPAVVAAGEPWLDVQDASLQQVLGVTLQELQDGGKRVAQQVAHAAEHLRQQLHSYSQQPLVAGLSSLTAVPDLPAQYEKELANACNGLHLEPVLVLLLHAYEEAVQEHCRSFILHHVAHDRQSAYGWEEAAEIAASEQVRWFKDKQLVNVMHCLSVAGGI